MVLKQYNYRILKVEMELTPNSQRLLADLQRQITIKNIVMEKGKIRFFIVRAN